jgi:hypothetical protein
MHVAVVSSLAVFGYPPSLEVFLFFSLPLSLSLGRKVLSWILVLPPSLLNVGCSLLFKG